MNYWGFHFWNQANSIFPGLKVYERKQKRELNYSCHHRCFIFCFRPNSLWCIDSKFVTNLKAMKLSSWLINYKNEILNLKPYESRICLGAGISREVSPIWTIVRQGWEILAKAGFTGNAVVAIGTAIRTWITGYIPNLVSICTGCANILSSATQTRITGLFELTILSGCAWSVYQEKYYYYE